jgi:hypothetical protein
VRWAVECRRSRPRLNARIGYTMFFVGAGSFSRPTASSLVCGVINHATNSIASIDATARNLRLCANALRLRGVHSVYDCVGSSDNCYVRNIRRKFRSSSRKCDLQPETSMRWTHRLPICRCGRTSSPSVHCVRGRLRSRMKCTRNEVHVATIRHAGSASTLAISCAEQNGPGH